MVVGLMPHALDDFTAFDRQCAPFLAAPRGFAGGLTREALSGVRDAVNCGLCLEKKPAQHLSASSILSGCRNLFFESEPAHQIQLFCESHHVCHC